MATGRYGWMLPNPGEERTAELGVTGQKAHLASDSMRKKQWKNLPYNTVYAYTGSVFGSYASNLGFSVLVRNTCYGRTVLALKPSSSCGYIQFSWMTHSLVSVFHTSSDKLAGRLKKKVFLGLQKLFEGTIVAELKGGYIMTCQAFS